MKKQIAFLGTLSVLTPTVLSVVSCQTEFIEHTHYFRNQNLSYEIKEAVADITGKPNEVLAKIDPIVQQYAKTYLSDSVKTVISRATYFSYFNDIEDTSNDQYKQSLLNSYNFGNTNFSVEIRFEALNKETNLWEFTCESIGVYNFEEVIKSTASNPTPMLFNTITFTADNDLEFVYNEILEQYTYEILKRIPNLRQTNENRKGFVGSLTTAEFNVEILSNGIEITDVSQLVGVGTYNIIISNKPSSKISVENEVHLKAKIQLEN